MDLIIIVAADFIHGLNWFWQAAILTLFGGFFFVGLLNTIVIASVYGISKLFNPHPKSASVIMVILSIINFLYLAYIIWIATERSFALLFYKLTLTAVTFFANYTIAAASATINELLSD